MKPEEIREGVAILSSLAMAKLDSADCSDGLKLQLVIGHCIGKVVSDWLDTGMTLDNYLYARGCDVDGLIPLRALMKDVVKDT